MPKKSTQSKPSRAEQVSGEGLLSTVLLASSIARKAHAGQFRRDGITPYITHPEAVAKSLEGEHPDVIAAAWLHDVIEDTDVKASDLRMAGIPASVIGAVELLTKSPSENYNSYLGWIRFCEIARKVKIADIRHNLSDAPTEKQIAKYGKALLILANVQVHLRLTEGAVSILGCWLHGHGRLNSQRVRR